MDNANSTTPSPPSGKWKWIAIGAIVLSCIVFVCASPFAFLIEQSRPDRYARKLQRSIDELKAGKSTTLHLIGYRDTDSLLVKIRGMPEIERIYMESVDVTAVGMRHIGTLPNLQSITAYAGVDGDTGFLELRTCKKLKSVEIYDGRITDDAIAELQRYLPNANIFTKHQ